MVIDSSVLVAILFNEIEKNIFLNLIINHETCFLSSLSYLETKLVIYSKMREAGIIELEQLIAKSDIKIIDFSPTQSQLAFEAWLKFGKGRHPAKLNMGDCCTYALAKATGEPLLFKGFDFDKTDLEFVVY